MGPNDTPQDLPILDFQSANAYDIWPVPAHLEHCLGRRDRRAWYEYDIEFVGSAALACTNNTAAATAS